MERLSDEGIIVLDVRPEEEYRAGHIPGAISVPIDALEAALQTLPKDREIVTYCACPKDQSSIAAAQILQAGGFTRVKVLRGGWHEWLRVNGPVQPK